MSNWATSKFTPGKFLGSTGANILSAKELQSGFQAWAKRVSANGCIWILTDFPLTPFLGNIKKKTEINEKCRSSDQVASVFSFSSSEI